MLFRCKCSFFSFKFHKQRTHTHRSKMHKWLKYHKVGHTSRHALGLHPAGVGDRTRPLIGERRYYGVWVLIPEPLYRRLLHTALLLVSHLRLLSALRWFIQQTNSTAQTQPHAAQRHNKTPSKKASLIALSPPSNTRRSVPRAGCLLKGRHTVSFRSSRRCRVSPTAR